MLRDKDIREAMGLSQVELAKRLGVSRSTIQRYEYGTSKNAAVAKFYEKEKMAHGLEYEYAIERRKVVDKVRKLSRLGIKSPSMYWLESRGGVPSIDASTASKGETRQAINIMKDFLDMKTSTVEGYKSWYENVTNASLRTSGSQDITENKAFWTIYNRILNDTGHSKYIKEVKGRFQFDSDQAVKDIKEKFKWGWNGDPSTMDAIMQEILEEEE